MKRLVALLLLVTLAPAAFGQDAVLDVAKAAAQEMDRTATEQKGETPEAPKKPGNWKGGLKLDIGLDQTGFVNWAAGGYNTVSIRTAFDGHLDYIKGASSWKNRLQLEYGFMYSSDKPWPLIQKTNDQIYLESKWTHALGNESKWKYLTSFDFRSQFAPGYEYKTPPGENPTVEEWKAARELKSNFLSPAYTNLALGFEWCPAAWITLNLAPATAGFTIVSDPLLRADYGMDLRPGVVTPTSGDDYQFGKFQIGAQLKADVKFNIDKKFLFESQLVLFTDYLHEPYIRVNWDNKIEWMIARFFKIGLYTWTIYDPWVLNNGAPRGRQFKESVTLGFTYTLHSKTK